jgi:RNA polymerase sigma-70 factor (ECF subfamily)
LSRDQDVRAGLARLRLAIRLALDPALPAAAWAGEWPGEWPGGADAPWLLSEAVGVDRPGEARDPSWPSSGGFPSGSTPRGSTQQAEPADTRLVALVELARSGDAEAFGLLYDHYHLSVYRFVYYRVGSVQLAEDLTSETFLRALRSMGSFRWQGKDFGAWLVTIARNLTADHFKAGRTRLEQTTEDMSLHDGWTEGPDTVVLASLTNDALLAALKELPHEQQECLIMRFLQGLSIAETAKVLGRTAGAVKQLQLRAVRNLAKLLPDGVR